MSEQQSQPTTTTTQQIQASACPHPEAIAKRWGDPISDERKAELQGYLDRWQAETDHGERKGPFEGPFDGRPANREVPLTGADLFWLAACSAARAHFNGDMTAAAEQLRTGQVRWQYLDLSALHLELADLRAAHLEGADLSMAHLETLYVNTLTGVA